MDLSCFDQNSSKYSNWVSHYLHTTPCLSLYLDLRHNRNPNKNLPGLYRWNSSDAVSHHITGVYESQALHQGPNTWWNKATYPHLFTRPAPKWNWKVNSPQNMQLGEQAYSPVWCIVFRQLCLKCHFSAFHHSQHKVLLSYEAMKSTDACPSHWERHGFGLWGAQGNRLPRPWWRLLQLDL